LRVLECNAVRSVAAVRLAAEMGAEALAANADSGPLPVGSAPSPLLSSPFAAFTSKSPLGGVAQGAPADLVATRNQHHEH
jgi:hypothetical protein